MSDTKNDPVKQALDLLAAASPGVPHEVCREYVNALRYHDWYYQHSDDSRAFLIGDTQRKWLDQTRPLLDPEYRAWDLLAPEAFRARKPARAVTQQRPMRQIKFPFG